jgi:hypothetical protein
MQTAQAPQVAQEQSIDLLLYQDSGGSWWMYTTSATPLCVQVDTDPNTPGALGAMISRERQCVTQTPGVMKGSAYGYPYPHMQIVQYIARLISKKYHATVRAYATTGPGAAPGQLLYTWLAIN